MSVEDFSAERAIAVGYEAKRKSTRLLSLDLLLSVSTLRCYSASLRLGFYGGSDKELQINDKELKN
jgi:hypothetical protein